MEPGRNPTQPSNTTGVAAQPRERRFYTVAEAADLLRLSAPTLYREIRAGRFPAIRVRGRYVIPAKAVDAMEEAALTHGVVEPEAFGRDAGRS
jgi:excisionase family DNA binding protein